MPDSDKVNAGTPPNQDAGQDRDIAKRLENDPTDANAKLDAGLDESMDASDPPSMTVPGRPDPLPPLNGD